MCVCYMGTGRLSIGLEETFHLRGVHSFVLIFIATTVSAARLRATFSARESHQSTVLMISSVFPHFSIRHST